MVSKKSILWALVVVVAIGTTAILRHQRHQRKAAASAQAKKEKKERSEDKKDKSNPEEEPAEKPPAPKKPPKVTVLGQAAREHLAEKSFISALRAVFIWRSSQPVIPETNRVLLEKLSAIACEDLPPDRKSAWQSLLQAWKYLSDPDKAMDPQLKEQAQRASETLNAMLKAHGDGDIAL